MNKQSKYNILFHSSNTKLQHNPLYKTGCHAYVLWWVLMEISVFYQGCSMDRLGFMTGQVKSNRKYRLKFMGIICLLNLLNVCLLRNKMCTMLWVVGLINSSECRSLVIILKSRVFRIFQLMNIKGLCWVLILILVSMGMYVVLDQMVNLISGKYHKISYKMILTPK